MIEYTVGEKVEILTRDGWIPETVYISCASCGGIHTLARHPVRDGLHVNVWFDDEVRKVSEEEEQPTWTMPEWMERYRKIIWTACGETLEEFMNDRTPVAVNAPRVTLMCAVKGKVVMLEALHAAGLLKGVDHENHDRD